MPSPGDNCDGIYHSSDLFYSEKTDGAITTDDIANEVRSQNIKFCKDCLIQIYACKVEGLLHPLANATGCTVIGANDLCSPSKDESAYTKSVPKWQTDGKFISVSKNKKTELKNSYKPQ